MLACPILKANPLSTTNSFVYISSAGVDRVTRPGLDLEAEPPAVRMNDMLGAFSGLAFAWTLRLNRKRIDMDGKLMGSSSTHHTRFVCRLVEQAAS